MPLGSYLSSTIGAGTTNDFTPAGFSSSVGRLDIDPNAGASTINGLLAGSDGQLLVICNIDAVNNLTLANQAAGSSAANRFRGPGADLTLLPFNAVWAVYYAGSVNRWVLV